MEVIMIGVYGPKITGKKEALREREKYEHEKIHKINAVIRALNETADPELILKVEPILRAERAEWIHRMMKTREEIGGLEE